MAATFRFYKIGEANAEIARLEAELTKATARISELEGGTTGNEAELSKQLTERDQQITKLTSENAALKAEKEAAEKKAKAAEENTDKKAAEKAIDLVASTGLPKPLAVKPTEDPAATAPKAADLKGRDRFIASFKLS